MKVEDCNLSSDGFNYISDGLNPVGLKFYFTLAVTFTVF